jgi:hypothetical protein
MHRISRSISPRRALLAWLAACCSVAATPGRAAEPGLAWTDVRIAPDGELLGILVSAGAERALAVADPARRTHRWISDPTELDIESYAWAGERRLVLTARDPSGASRAYVVEATDGAMRALEAPADGLSDPRVVDPVPSDHRHALIAWRAAGGETLYRVDLGSGRATQVEAPFTDVRAWLADDHGQLRAVAATLQLGEPADRLFLRSVGTDVWREVAVAALAGERLTPLALAPGGERIYASATTGNGYALWQLDPGSQGLEPLATDLSDPPALLVGPRSGRLLAIDLGAELPQRLVDPEWAAVGATIDAALPESLNRIHDLSRNEQRALVLSCSALDGCAYYLLDRRSSRLEFLGAATPPARAEEVLL